MLLFLLFFRLKAWIIFTVVIPTAVAQVAAMTDGIIIICGFAEPREALMAMAVAGINVIALVLIWDTRIPGHAFSLMS